MISYAAISKIVELNGFYCTKKSANSEAIVRSSRLESVRLGDVVISINQQQTKRMSKAELSSAIARKLQSYEVMSPGTSIPYTLLTF